METLKVFFEGLFYVVLTVVVVGMIRPWWVLWFLDLQNRWTVLKIWGTILILVACIRIVLCWL